jgi:hypothetical protein
MTVLAVCPPGDGRYGTTDQIPLDEIERIAI